MSSAESKGWQAGVDVGKVVVVVGDFEEAGVLVAIAVRVTDERSFPLLNRLADACYTIHRKVRRTWSWNLVHETVTSSLAWVISRRPS